MNLTPLVSFCISTYKRPTFIVEQVDKLLKQTYTNFEIVISDNDEEESAKIVTTKFNDSRVKYFPNKINFGMVKSFNKSIERSIGDFVVMVTDDDPVEEFMLEELVLLYNKYPSYGVYSGYGDLLIKNKESADKLKIEIGRHDKCLKTIKINEIIIVEKNNFLDDYISGIFNSTYLLWSCMMIKRDILIKNNGMPDYGSEFLTDHAMVIASGSVDGFVFVNKSMGAQLIHGANFGFDFLKLTDKYIKVSSAFFNYISKYTQNVNEKKLWNYIGRCQVEYSLISYRGLNYNDKKKFWIFFNKVFENSKIKKWKYKFYIKLYFNDLFKILIYIKNKLKINV